MEIVRLVVKTFIYFRVRRSCVWNHRILKKILSREVIVTLWGWVWCLFVWYNWTLKIQDWTFRKSQLPRILQLGRKLNMEQSRENFPSEDVSGVFAFEVKFRLQTGSITPRSNSNYHCNAPWFWEHILTSLWRGINLSLSALSPFSISYLIKAGSTTLLIYLWISSDIRMECLRKGILQSKWYRYREDVRCSE